MAEPLVLVFTKLPPVEYSANESPHWGDRMRAGDEWRFVARIDIHRQLPRGYPLPLKTPVEATVVVVIPKSKFRRVDAESYTARLKPLWDMLIAEGILQDDRHEWLKVHSPEIVRADRVGLDPPLDPQTEGLLITLAGADSELPKGKRASD